MNKKEEVLKEITGFFDKKAVTIFKDSEEQIVVAGVVGFPDTQMFFTGVLDHEGAAGIMLTLIAGLAKNLKVLDNEEVETLMKFADKFRHSSEQHE